MEPRSTGRYLQDGTLTLDPGTHVVRWTAIGEADVRSVFQTVVVNPGSQAVQRIDVGDRASVGIAGSITQFSSAPS